MRCTVKLFLEIKHSSPVTPVIPVLGKVKAGRQEFKTTLATRRIQSYMRPWLKQTTNNQKGKKAPQTPLCLWILTPLPHTLGWRMLRLLPSPLPLTTARIKFFWLVPCILFEDPGPVLGVLSSLDTPTPAAAHMTDWLRPESVIVSGAGDVAPCLASKHQVFGLSPALNQP